MYLRTYVFLAYNSATIETTREVSTGAGTSSTTEWRVTLTLSPNLQTPDDSEDTPKTSNADTSANNEDMLETSSYRNISTNNKNTVKSSTNTHMSAAATDTDVDGVTEVVPKTSPGN